jgi:LysR family transcriptional regulator, glycine cleavage system transcriptional activator
MPALMAFESAARLLSFKDAATEMDVTPSAISQHVKSLEQLLQTNLFERKHRGVELTEAGRLLHGALEHGLNHLAQAVNDIEAMSGQRPVTIYATTAMSSLWLTPRLAQFWKEHGDVSVNQFVSDTDSYRANECDLKIWYGQPFEFESDARLLFKDRLVPVCSPRYAKSLTDHSVTSLSEQKLIHLDSFSTGSSWTTWPEWFGLHGCEGDFSKGPRMNSYSIAVQAAIDDVGFVLGWERLLRPLIQQEALVPISELALDAPHSFYISSPSGKALSEPAALLKDWLLDSLQA